MTTDPMTTLPASEETVPDTYTGITDEAIRKACARIYGDTWSLEKAIKLRNLINDTIQTAHEQAVRECAENGWHPIETAPKGGKRILLSLQNSRVCEGYWGAARYNRKTKEYERDWVSSPNSGALQATHWQPLPTPPSLSQVSAKT